MPVTPEAKEQLQAKIKEARENGQTSFPLKGFNKPVPVEEAEFILQTFSDVHDDVRKGTFKPGKPPGTTRR